MAGSGVLESMSMAIRAAEGLAFLALAGVVLAIGYLAERRSPRTVKTGSGNHGTRRKAR
jgi:hypothetical protein